MFEFKNGGMFLFYDTGRRGRTGEGCPTVALFAGQVSQYLLSSRFLFVVLMLEIRPNRVKPHNTQKEIPLQPHILMSFHVKSFILVALFKIPTEERLQVCAAVKLKLCISDPFPPSVSTIGVHEEACPHIKSSGHLSKRPNHIFPLQTREQIPGKLFHLPGLFILAYWKLMITKRYLRT